jgi:hypothetical protein
MSTLTPKPVTHTCLVGDIKCYLCGTISGSIEHELKSASGSVWFRKRGEQQAVPVHDRLQVRCIRCGGSTYVDDLRTVTRRWEPQAVSDLRRRRGRPTKRRTEQRAPDFEPVLERTA